MSARITIPIKRKHLQIKVLSISFSRKLMQRFLSVLLFIGLYSDLKAQQKPEFTQYIFNNYLNNSALTGIENYTDIKAGYRKQWTGFDGAPESNYFSLHCPIGKKDIRSTATSSGGQDNNPMSRSYTQTYMAAAPHHGVGFHIMSDKAGPFQQLDLNLTYAYHLGMSATTNLSFGVAAGIRKLGVSTADITLTNDLDPVLARNNNNILSPDVALGIWFYGSQYFLGISGQQLLKSSAKNSATPIQNMSIFTITGGYNFYAGESIGIIPSIMLRQEKNQPSSRNLNLKVAFADKFWLGVGYRDKDSFSALAGLYINSLFNLSYSYDYTISNLAQVNSGSHEIVLGLMLNNIYKVTCPQENW